MQKITLDEFDRERWNRGEDHPKTKPWFWVSPEYYIRENWIAWLHENCAGKIFIIWDTANNKGRIWFDYNEDAMRYRLHW